MPGPRRAPECWRWRAECRASCSRARGNSSQLEPQPETRGQIRAPDPGALPLGRTDADPRAGRMAARNPRKSKNTVPSHPAVRTTVLPPLLPLVRVDHAPGKASGLLQGSVIQRRLALLSSRGVSHAPERQCHISETPPPLRPKYVTPPGRERTEEKILPPSPSSRLHTQATDNGGTGVTP